MVRHKNRYIVTLITEQGRKADDGLILNAASLYHAILAKVQQLYGDFGVAAIRAGFTAKYCNAKTRIAIVRCRHGPHRFVASSLPCINAIEKKHVRVNILYIGATIKQCFRFLLKYQQKKYDEFCAGLKTEEEKAAMREVVLNFDSVLEMT